MIYVYISVFRNLAAIFKIWKHIIIKIPKFLFPDMTHFLICFTGRRQLGCVDSENNTFMSIYAV